MGWYSKASLALFTGISLLMTPATKANAQTIEPQQWDGQWYRLNEPAEITLHNATSQTVDIIFRNGVGTATIDGNTAVYSSGNAKATFVMTQTDQIHVLGKNVPLLPAENLDGTYVKKNPLPRITLSVTKQNRLKVTGSTLFAPGTWLVIEVSNGKGIPIYWETTVGKGGIIDSEKDMSWFPSGKQNLVAKVSVMSHGTGSGYKDMGTILQVTSNPVQMTIQHKNIGQDVRKYYKPGTPAYTVADFVYRAGSATVFTSNGMEKDTLPGHETTIMISQMDDWINPKGVDIYGLHFVSKTNALTDTTLLMKVYNMQEPGNDITGGVALYFDYEFKLAKYQGKWLIDGTDLDTALSRLQDVTHDW
jgi:hypothetical protein